MCGVVFSHYNVVSDKNPVENSPRNEPRNEQEKMWGKYNLLLFVLLIIVILIELLLPPGMIERVSTCY
jgi:hypothetical protein